MSTNFLDVLARHATAGELDKLDPVARKLDVLSQQLAAILSGLNAASRLDLLAQFDAEVLAALKKREATGAGPATGFQDNPQGDSTTAGGNSTCPATGTSTPPKQEKEFLAENITPEMREWARQSRENLTPEILEWAMRDFNVEEALASVQEVHETGGLELRDFIQELEQLAAHHD
jgi:hypothetical protein